MSLPASDGKFARRGRRGRRGRPAWGAEEEEEEEEETWGRSPSPRRSRWERPAPAHWAPEEPPDEPEAERDAWGRASPSPPPVWERPEARRAWGKPPSEDGGSQEEPRRQWEARPGGGRWSSAERAGGGRRGPPDPGAPSRQRRPNGEGRAWGSPWREGAQERRRSGERPDWEARPGGWAPARRRREASQSPSRERRSLGSSGRDGRQECRGGDLWNQPSREEGAGGSEGDGAGGRWGRTWRGARTGLEPEAGGAGPGGGLVRSRWQDQVGQERSGREQRSPQRRQSGRSSSQREARQESSGTTRYHHAREQNQANPDEAEGRWREKSYHSRSKEEGNWEGFKGEWQSPNREEKGQGSFIKYREVEKMEDGGGGGAEWNRRERGGQKKWMDAAGSSSPEESVPFTGSLADSPAVPKEWTPCDSVLYWWARCHSPLQRKLREHLMSTCPRPTLPDRSSETPQINPQILSLLSDKEQRELRGVTRANIFLQEEVLDLLAPAMTIYEMAEEAMEKDEPVDPMELRQWARRVLRFIGSINSRLNFQHRSQVLSAINPRLRMVASKLKGQSNDGMLFAEDKVKLLKEIIMRFPQLTAPENRRYMAMKKLQTWPRAAYYKRRPLQGPLYKPVGTGRQGAAVQRVGQSYSEEANEQDPAEWQ